MPQKPSSVKARTYQNSIFNGDNMTYHNAIKYIKNSPNITPKDTSAKSRIDTLLSALGSPQKKIKYIRLAGNNGKSVCAQMMTCILNESNILSGSLTMPLLFELRENIKIGGQMISMEETVSFTEAVVKAVAEINASAEQADVNARKVFAPTAHEIMLCIALLAFELHKCKIVFIESDQSTDDPSRFLPIPMSAIICGAIPNDNKEEISKMQSYIQRGLTDVVSVPQDADAFQIIQSTCHAANCRLTISVPQKASVTTLNLGGTKFSYKNNEYALRICGRFQVTNAILAIETCNVLSRNGYKIEQNHIAKGLQKTTLPSKFEILSVSPTIIIDSTYAPIAIETVCDSMAELKDFIGNKVRLCLPLGELCEQYTEALTARGYNIESIYALSLSDDDDADPLNNLQIPTNVFNTPKQIAKKVLASLDKDTILLVSGKTNISEKIRYEILSILGF